MEINLTLLKKNLSFLNTIKKTFEKQEIFLKQKIKEYDKIMLELSDLFYNTCIFKFAKNEKLLVSQCKEFIEKYQHIIFYFKKELLAILKTSTKNFDISEIVRLINMLELNIFIINIINYENCIKCNTFLVRHKNFYYCQNCSTLKGKIFLFKDEELEEDIKQNKTNIAKHYDATINRIYGVGDDKNLIPEEIVVRLRQILKKRGFDIHKQVHYSYSLINELKIIGNVQAGTKKYNFANQKKYVNYILKKLYPELEIPRLTCNELAILQNTFLAISSMFQQLYPKYYSNNYQYTIHRILYILFYDREHVMKLLRFIYLQKPNSFKTKDDKLKNINDHLHCFKDFIYLPQDVYTNINYYDVINSIIDI